MMKTWGHILNGLCEVLGNDPKVRTDVFDQEFTEKKVCRHTVFPDSCVDDSPGL